MAAWHTPRPPDFFSSSRYLHRGVARRRPRRRAPLAVIAAVSRRSSRGLRRGRGFAQGQRRRRAAAVGHLARDPVGGHGAREINPTAIRGQREVDAPMVHPHVIERLADHRLDRKSTRLNSSHQIISYAVFCLKKKIAVIRNWQRLSWISIPPRRSVRSPPPTPRQRSIANSTSRFFSLLMLHFTASERANTHSH